jgi:hypothetical protein
MHIDLYKQFKDWLDYNFPGTEFTTYQEKVLRVLFEEEVPRTKQELAQRFKELLPKSRK